MRRGLISWSREEVPVAVLDGRVGRLQEAMRKQGIGAVFAYTSFIQPAAVHWLCNFVPYWSEALLVVLPEGRPQLLAALTKRVYPWIREVSHLSQVIAAPRLGAGALSFIEEHVTEGKIGIVGLDEVPSSVMLPLLKQGVGERLVDASEIFSGLRQPCDQAELTLARQASAIGARALRAIPERARRASEVLAAVELSARLAGAEEVLQRIAPNLVQDATLVRMEGDAVLGEQYAIEISVAYKGAWVRVAESRSSVAVPSDWTVAQDWFLEMAQGITTGGVQSDVLARAPGSLSRWTLEASVGMAPLAVVAASDRASWTSLPPGSLAVLSAQLDFPGGAWHRSLPLLTAMGGRAEVLSP